MPKSKTHKGTAKRFKVTGSGQLKHKRAGKAHLNEHKPTRRTRRLDVDGVLEGADAKKMKKLMGGYKPKSKRG